MNKPLDNIRIVLIQTSHPGNIGAAARAMKTMGLSRLYLVNPRHFPDEQATARASGADDVLQNVVVVSSLDEAIADCHFVIGSSARSERTLQWPVVDTRECGEVVAEKVQDQQVAILFGRERTGLTNEELECCHLLAHIPSNPEYRSLNVASAVQLFSYECAIHVNKTTIRMKELDEDIVDQKDMHSFYQHLEATLTQIRYLNPENPRYLMRRLKRLFGRIQVTRSEMNILRGVLSAMEGRKFRAREERDE